MWFTAAVVWAGTTRTTFYHAVEDRVGSLIEGSRRWGSHTLLLLGVVDEACCRFRQGVQHWLSTVAVHDETIGVGVLLVKLGDSLSLGVAIKVAWMILYWVELWFGGGGFTMIFDKILMLRLRHMFQLYWVTWNVQDLRGLISLLWYYGF